MKPSLFSKTIKLFFILFVVLISEKLNAQTISEIRFIGLTRTKYSYLRDHIIKTKAGEPIDSIKIKKDVQEIYNLRHFSSVNFSLIKNPDSTSSILNFIVTETFSMFPVLDIGLTKDFLKIQAGAVDFNSFGRSGNTSVYIRRMGRITYMFNGDYPYLLKGKHGIAADINKVGTYEPIYYNQNKNEFSYDLYTALIMHRYDFNLHSFIKTGIGYQYETFRPHIYAKLPTEYPLKANAQRLMFRLNFRYTKINLNRINQNGIYFDVSYNAIATDAKRKTILQRNSRKLLADIRYYTNLNSSTNLAIRIRTGIGNSSFFDQFVLDDNTNIRGIGFKRFRQNKEFVVNIETRQTVYRHPQGVLQVVLFNDFSIGHNFIGGGLRAYLEQIHGVVLRCDYGMDVKDFSQGGIVAGIHQYF